MVRSAIGQNTGAPLRHCAKNASPEPKRYKTASTETLHYKITSDSQFLRQKDTKTEQRCLSLSSIVAAQYRLTVCTNNTTQRQISVLFGNTVQYNNSVLHCASRR
jgi:hypothetical protein